MKVDIAGVQVDNISKSEAIGEVDKSVRTAKNVYIVTPYSEMIVFAQSDEQYKKVLNNASLALPDGIGILWASKYLSLTTKHFPLITSLLAIIFNPRYIRSIIKEQVTGSRLIYDIALLASEKNYSLALVGGKQNVAVKAAVKLKAIYPKLRINLAQSDRQFDDTIVEEINNSNSDILLLAYSPPKQEKWLSEHIQNLNVKVALGLGGTFDYIAGKRPTAPNFMHYIGLEWLWRLITQPRRIKRMWNAIPVFIWKVYKYKKYDRS